MTELDFVLFANTGVQYIKTDIFSGKPTSKWFMPVGTQEWKWLRCRVINGYLVLAVDTTTGPVEHGYFAKDENSIIHRDAFKVEHDSRTYSMRITIRGSEDGAGTPKPTSLVLDFGNCRSMGLLVEQNQAGDNHLCAQPFSLVRHNDISISPEGTQEREEVFDSHFQFVKDHQEHVTTTITKEVEPDPEEIRKRKRGLFRGKEPEPEPKIQKSVVITDLFKELSPVRLGQEATNMRMRIRGNDGVQTGLSSPKRYLWAKDPLPEDYWHHIVPEKTAAGRYYEPLAGPFFKFMHEDDADWESWTDLPSKSEMPPPQNPARARYPLRSTIVMCMYEIFCQAYAQMNSISYRKRTKDFLRKRLFSDVVITFPSGMSEEEKSRYETQVRKAIHIFAHSVLKDTMVPCLRMDTDEGTAGQLAYVYGEINAFGDAEAWLRTVGRLDEVSDQYKARIACIDIGGGTSDLMIADYVDDAPGPLTDLKCTTVYLDGLSKAGDDLILALLQQIILPTFANDLSIGKAAMKQFFEGSPDGVVGSAKRNMMTEIWLPVCKAYLHLAEKEDEQTDFSIGDVCQNQMALQELQEIVSKIRKISDPGEVRFQFNKNEFFRVVQKALTNVLYEFAGKISELDCDIVMLAGKTASLPAVQKLFRMFVNLPVSRIVPMHNFDTGIWYPLPSPNAPGVIEDPKSVVCVGSAIEYLSTGAQGIPGFRMELARIPSKGRSYYWGICTMQMKRFVNRHALFAPSMGDGAGKEEVWCETVGAETYIGKRISDQEALEVSPVYVIKINRDADGGRVRVRIGRTKPNGLRGERLHLLAAEGTILRLDRQGSYIEEPAEPGVNVFLELKTTYGDRYFLDQSTIEGIDYDCITEE